MIKISLRGFQRIDTQLNRFQKQMAQLPKIKVTKFDPTKYPWPKEIIKWPYNGYQPRDCSWGFVLDEKENQIHVHSGDLMISVFGEKYFCKKEKFKMFVATWARKIS